MAIARDIELYNSAYSLAWKHVSDFLKREKPNIARFCMILFDAKLRTGQPNLFSLPLGRLRMSGLTQKLGINPRR
jgi:hypothetical protein